MSIPYVPHAFVDGDNLDLEKLNDNMEAISRSLQRNLDARYSYSAHRFDLVGVTDLVDPSLRKFQIRRPATGMGVEIVAVELVIYTSVAVTWTLACSDATWPSITLLTTADATIESSASRGVAVSVPSAAADLTFTLSASGASTITAGYLVVHLRCDRGNQGTDHSGYFPVLLNSVSNLATELDVEVTNLNTAVGNDTANQTDLRAECYTIRNTASGTTVTFRAPQGARTGVCIRGYNVSAVGTDVTFTVGATGSLLVAGAGATVLATGVDATFTDVTTDDPMTAASDTTIAIVVSGGGTCLLAYVHVWWK